MVIEIPNQPISFIRDGESINQKNARLMWDRREYCQIVKTSQTQQFQFMVTENTGVNLVANGSFVANLNGWTQEPTLPSTVPHAWQWDNGKARSTAWAIPAHAATMYQDVVLTPARTYKMTYDFDFTGEPSSPTCMMSLIVIMGNAGIIGGKGNNVCDYIDGAGSYTIYFRTVDSINRLLFYFTNSDWATRTATLDNVRLVELTEPILVLEDCNNNYIRDITSVQRFEDKVTYTHSWENETVG